MILTPEEAESGVARDEAPDGQGEPHARSQLRLAAMPRYHVTTFGCQMNEHDSERMKGMLESLGYTEAADQEQADLILFNTCSIREKADDRFVAHLGHAKRLKREDPDRGSSVSAAAGRNRSRTRCSRAFRSSMSRSDPARSTSSPSF